MKKIILLLIVSLNVISCDVYKSFDPGKVTFGMSKAQTVQSFGQPERILVARQTQDGFQEVLEYKTYQKEHYAIEFWNDYLTGFELMYEETTYIPAPAPPVVTPVYGTPVAPMYRYQDKPKRSGNSNQPNPSGTGGRTDNAPSGSRQPEGGRTRTSETDRTSGNGTGRTGTATRSSENAGTSAPVSSGGRTQSTKNTNNQDSENTGTNSRTGGR